MRIGVWVEIVVVIVIVVVVAGAVVMGMGPPVTITTGLAMMAVVAVVDTVEADIQGIGIKCRDGKVGQGPCYSHLSLYDRPCCWFHCAVVAELSGVTVAKAAGGSIGACVTGTAIA